jgi:hypothetical protein
MSSQSTTEEEAAEQPQPEERDHSRGRALEEVQAANPVLILQLFLDVGNKHKLGFFTHNILLTNESRASKEEEHPKAFPTNLNFNDTNFHGQIVPAIERILEENVPHLELYSFTNQAFIYRRSEQLTKSYYSGFSGDITDNEIQEITCTPTLLTVARLGFNDNGEVATVWVPLLCHVRKKPNSKSNTNSRLSQENANDPLLGQLSQEEVGEIDLDSILPFGYDKSLRLVIQGPTYESEDVSGKFVIKSKGNDVYDLPPPFFDLEYLKTLTDHRSIPEDIRHKIGTIEPLIKATASLLPAYKDESGKTLLGVHSQFFIQPIYSSTEVVLVNETSAFWGLVRKRWMLMKPMEKKTNVIEIRCSLAARSSKDDPYSIPEFFYGDDEDDDDDLSYTDSQYGRQRQLQIVPEKLSRPDLFSQEESIRGRQQKKPPIMNTNKSSSTRRSEQTTTPKQMEEYLWKCHSDSQSPLYHSFTREHYVAIKDYLICYREDGRSIPDMFPCNDGEPGSWLELGDIPEHIRTKPYCGKLMEKGKYPPINAKIMSSYQCFEKTPEQIEEERVQKRQSNLQSILQALGPSRGGSGDATTAGGGGVSHQTESYVIRFILSEECSHGDFERVADILVPSNDERTLQELYDLKEIKEHVRSGFACSVVREVKAERKAVVLVY